MRCLVLLLAATVAAVAQAAPPAAPSLFSRPGSSWYISGQANYIYQAHGSFPAAFSGTNSLVNHPEDALSRVLTVYSAVRLGPRWELLGDLEETGGQGLSTALGMAAFPDVDVVRDPQLSTVPYVARALVHGVFGFGSASTPGQPNADSSFARLPRRRLEIWIGKYSLLDFFDTNAVSGSSHEEFLNWTINADGAYDYAANTRGYTDGAVIAWSAPDWGVRFGEALMPTTPNGIDLQYNLRQAHSENLEFEYHPGPVTARLLFYSNTANMGVYRSAIDQYLAGVTATPQIDDHPEQPETKRGLGLNLEAHPSASLGLFARLGFASGRYESYAFTEAEQSFSAGAMLNGARWGRPGDETGLAITVNGLSGDHRRYLQLGGLGFLLGDGGLVYGHEKVAEAFYTFAVWHGIYIGPDVQYAVNPGYDRARGPVWIPGARLHIDF